jgi:hypothetical protein
LEKQIEDLQAQQMDLLAYILDVKQNQHTNQSKLTTMNNRIELIDHNNQVALCEIRSCKLEMDNVNTILSTIATKHETETAFNKILSMFGDISASLRQLGQKQGLNTSARGSDSIDNIVRRQPRSKSD